MVELPPAMAGGGFDNVLGNIGLTVQYIERTTAMSSIMPPTVKPNPKPECRICCNA